MTSKTICVLGGTGFIGLHLVYRLASLGHSVTVLTRRPERHRALRISSSVRLLETNPYDPDALQAAIQDMDCVINLVGILNEEGKSSYHMSSYRALLSRLCAAPALRACCT